MPVIALPPSNTPRYWVDYQANGAEHTFQLRYAGGVTATEPDATFRSIVSSFLDDIAPLMPTDYAILGARYAPQGTDVTLPATPPILTAAGGGTPTQAERPAFLTFVGRSSAGRKTKLMIIGASASPASEGGSFADYRVLTSENATIASAKGTLAVLACVGIDGTSVTWYDYANAGYSAYWQKRQRAGV